MFFSNNKITGKIQPIRTISALTLSAILVLAFGSLALAADTNKIDLDKMTVNSSAITDASDVVNTGADLIYYQSGQSSDYGKSTDSSEQHTAAEAAAILTRYAK